MKLEFLYNSSLLHIALFITHKIINLPKNNEQVAIYKDLYLIVKKTSVKDPVNLEFCA